MKLPKGLVRYGPCQAFHVQCKLITNKSECAVGSLPMAHVAAVGAASYVAYSRLPSAQAGLRVPRPEPKLVRCESAGNVCHA